jgi:hypothetical protein
MLKYQLSHHLQSSIFSVPFKSRGHTLLCVRCGRAHTCFVSVWQSQVRASEEGNVIQVTQLLEGECVPVDAVGDRKRKTTALMAASAHGHDEVCQLPDMREFHSFSVFEPR